MTYEEAKELVDQGIACPVVLEWILTERDAPCKYCNDETLKSCQVCGSTGIVKIPAADARYSVSEIVYVSEDKDARTFRSGVAKKTPRVATIEKAHIERAYCSDAGEEERRRIELYSLTEFFTRMFLGKLENLIPAIQDEPANNPETRTGRDCDYGYAPFSLITEERTQGGIGVDMESDDRDDELGSLTIIDDPNQSIIKDDVV